MLKMCYVTNVFLGTYQDLMKSYFNELFPMQARQKPVKYLPVVSFNPFILVVTNDIHT